MKTTPVSLGCRENICFVVFFSELNLSLRSSYEKWGLVKSEDTFWLDQVFMIFSSRFENQVSRYCFFCTNILSAKGSVTTQKGVGQIIFHDPQGNSEQNHFAFHVGAPSQMIPRSRSSTRRQHSVRRCIHKNTD